MNFASLGLLAFAQAANGGECAASLDRLHALDSARRADSVAIFDAVRQSDSPCDRLLAAILGGVLSSPLEGEWQSRVAANDALDAAWRKWPNDPHLLFATGILRYNQGSRTDAGRALRRSLDSGSLTNRERAVVHFLLGRSAQDEWRDWRTFGALVVNTEGQWGGCAELRRDLGAEPGLTFTPVHFNVVCPAAFEDIMDRAWRAHTALNRESRDELETSYRSAIAADSGFWPPVETLAGELIFEQDWDRLGALARSVASAFREDYRVQALLALEGYRRGLSGDTAAARFGVLLAEMPPQARAVYEDVNGVLSPDEATRLNGVSDENKAAVRAAYWRSREVVFLDGVNERLIEHYARVTEAAFLFGEPTTGRPGWDSEAGQIWIRYGRPLKMRDLALEAGRASFWSYGPDPDFVFRRNLRAFAYRADEDVAGFIQQMAERVPARFKPPTLDTVVTLPREVVRFWSPKDSTHDLVVLAPYVGPGPRSELRVGVTLLDEVFRRATSWSGKGTSEPGLVASLALRQSGVFNLVVEQLDPTKRRLAQSRDTLTLVRPVGLSLSDLLVARRISGAARGAVWRELRIEHTYGLPLLAAQEFSLYWEVYNPPVDSTGVARYTVAVEIRDAQAKPLLARVLSGVTGRTGSLSVIQFEHTAVLVDGKVPNWINLQAALKPGPYSIRLTVTDGRSGQSTTARREIRVQ